MDKFECHAHSKVYHPKYFAGFLTPFIDKHTQTTVGFLHNLNPFSKRDTFDRLGRFLEYSDKSQRQVIDELVHNNPNKYICVKIMDLSYMGAGKVEKTILQQFYELLELKKEYPQLLLYPVIDPRNENLSSIYNTMVAHIKDIAGFGFYPNIGYTVTDWRLDKFFELLDSYGKSCIIHCTNTSPVYYKGKKLESLLRHLKSYYFYKDSNDTKELCGNFMHPYFTIERAIKHRNVNFNLAHFGGEDKYIRELVLNAIEFIDNIYADISSTFENDCSDLEKYIKNPKLNKKILPGRDWYMSVILKNNPRMKGIENKLQENAKKFLRL